MVLITNIYFVLKRYLLYKENPGIQHLKKVGINKYIHNIIFYTNIIKI